MNKSFVIGCQRSGTTWIHRILKTHPLICGGEESHFFRLFAPILIQSRQMAASTEKRKVGPLVYISDEELVKTIHRLWDAVFNGFYSEHPDALVHLEKTPDHALNLNEIKEIFPDSKIIVVHRDSRAVVSSLVAAGRGWGANWAPNSYRKAAIWWHVYVNAIETWRKKNPHFEVLELRFEEFVDDPLNGVKRTFEFLSLPEMNISEIKDLIDRVSVGQDDPKGFARKRGKEGWKKDLPWLGKIITWYYTRRMMKELGYECRVFK